MTNALTLPGQQDIPPLYSKRQPPDIARCVTAVQAPAGADEFNTAAFFAGDTGAMTLYLDAFINPATNLWTVNSVEQIGDMIRQQPLLQNLCFFDALRYCAEWEWEQKNRNSRPAEHSQEDDTPHYLAIAKTANIPVDINNLPLPVASGRILVEATVTGDQRSIARQSRSTPLALPPLPVAVQEPGTILRNIFPQQPQLLPGEQNAGPVYDINTYHPAIVLAEVFLKKTFRAMVQGIKSEMLTDPPFSRHLEGSIHHSGTRVANSGNYQFSRNEYSNSKWKQRLQKHLGTGIISGPQDWQGKIRNELGSLTAVFNALPEEPPKLLLQAFAKAIWPSLLLQTAAEIYIWSNNNEKIKAAPVLWKDLEYLVDLAAGDAGIPPEERRALKESIKKRTFPLNPQETYLQKLSNILNQSKEMLGFEKPQPQEKDRQGQAMTATPN